MKNKKFFTNIFSNLLIFLVIVSVFTVTLNSGATSLTSGDSYSAIYKGNENNSNVSLMINVYWGTEYIESMLDILSDNNVKATFFVGGTWANSNTDMLKKIHEAGHEIGNHGYYHKDHTRINKQRNHEEINITHELVKALIGVDMDLFAPPSGAFNSNTLEVANRLGYKTIMWSKDTIDWRDKNTQLIYNRATNNMQNGDLVLMHPTKNTVEALDDIIKYYLNNNFQVVTVTENIS